MSTTLAIELSNPTSDHEAEFAAMASRPLRRPHHGELPIRPAVSPCRRGLRQRSRRAGGPPRADGLRVSEGCASDVEDLGIERGHRTLRIMGKGSKPAVIPLVPRTARTIDLAVGERSPVPILRRTDGLRLDRRTAHRSVRSIGRRAGLGHVHQHMLRATFIIAALDAGMSLRDVQLAARHADPRTTTVYDHRRQASTATPPASWSPSWPEADQFCRTKQVGAVEPDGGGPATWHLPECRPVRDRAVRARLRPARPTRITAFVVVSTVLSRIQ
jgi:integrase